MNKKLKVVTIGGGSSYTPELIEGFIKRYDQFPLTELWLVDIEKGKEKLEIVAALARRMIHKANLPIEIHTTLNRREALVDADFVTTQIRVGLLDARINDERIPLSHGLIGQETNGLGGMFKALRTIPVLLDIVKDIQELCPEAWLINFTNPSGMVTQAILQHTSFRRVVGLCNLPINMHLGISKLLNADPGRVHLELTGVNHFIYATDVFLDGVSVLDRVLEIYSKLGKEDVISMKNFISMPFSKSLLYGLRAIPCPYHNYYYFTKEQLETELDEFSKGCVRAQRVKEAEKNLFEKYKDTSLDVKPEELSLRGGAHYSDAACNLISSIYSNAGDIQYVNTLNNGTIKDLEDDEIIECACIITKDGPKPLNIGKMNRNIRGPIQMIKGFENLCIQAAVTGNKDIAIAALNNNPLITSDELANQIFDEMLEVNKEYLPQFFKD